MQILSKSKSVEVIVKKKFLEITFSLASLMQFWSKSRICCLSRQESESASEDWDCNFAAAAAALRRMAAARAARAWARSSLSSLEKKGLVGDWMRAATGSLCFWPIAGLGLRVSAMEDGTNNSTIPKIMAKTIFRW